MYTKTNEKQMESVFDRTVRKCPPKDLLREKPNENQH